MSKTSNTQSGGEDADLTGRLKAILQEKKALQELYAANLAYGKSIGMTKEEVNKVNRAYGIQTEMANKVAKAAQEGYKYVEQENGALLKVKATRRDILAITSLQQNIDEGQNDIVRARVQATADLAKQHVMLATGLKEEYAEQALQLNAAREMGALTKQEYEKAVKQLQNDQHQVEAIKKQKELMEEIANKQAELVEHSEAYKKKFEGYLATAKAIISSPAALAGAAIAAAGKMGEAFSEAYKELKAEGLSTSQAIHESFTSFTDSLSTGFMVSSAHIREARKAISETGGTLHDAEEAGAAAAEMAAKFGGSAADAGKAIGNLSRLPGMTKEAAKNTAEFNAKLAQAADVPADTVTKAIASNMNAAALAGPKMQDSLAKAAINAKKLGVEFSVIEGIQSKLLDFEGSMNAQMEASVLLGREINLDKAREYANAGDYAKLQEEILKNVGSEAEFAEMSVIQKQKMAEALGVSVGDLAKMVKGQGEMTDLAKEQAEAAEDQSGTLALVKNFVAENAGAAMEMLGTLISMGAQYFMQRAQTKAITGELQKQTAEIQKQNSVKGKGAGKGAGGDMSTDASSTAKGSDKVKGGGGFKGAMSNLAEGFKEMGAPKVREGIKNVALAGPAMLLAMIATPFMLVVSLLGKPAGLGLQGLSEGLKGKGMGAALVSTGVANLAAFGLAGAVGILAIPFMLTMLLGKFIGMGLQGLAGGLKALANPAVAIGVGILSLLVISVGAGMMMFGIGVGIAAAGMSLLVTSLKDVPFKDLMVLPMAFTGLAAGLTMVAIAGALAMPILTELILLASVAPALVALGAAVGGIVGAAMGGGEEEDQMGELIKEVKSLKTEMSKGGVVLLDGKKVGDALRLYAMNTTGLT